MEPKILAFLKTKLPGVQESYLNGIAAHYAKTVTDEATIATTLSDGVIDLLKMNAGILQAEGDRRATEAQKTAVKNALDKLGLDETGKPKTPVNTSNPNPDEPPWFATYRKQQEEATAALKTELEGFKKKETTAQLSAKITAKLKEKGIPESYLKGRNLSVEKEDEIDQLVTTVDGDYTAFKQEMAEQGVIISKPPMGGGPKGEEVTVTDYLKEKFPSPEPKK